MALLDDIPFLEVEVDPENAEVGALNILKVIRPEWRAEEMKFKVFDEGITNKLIGCYQQKDESWSDMVLVRVYGQMTDLIIDRKLEMINMLILHSAGCGGQLYCRFQNGISYEFMNGECLDEQSVRDPTVARLIAKELAALQGIRPDQRFQLSENPCLFTKLRSYLQSVPDVFPNAKKQERFARDCKSRKELEKEVDLLQAELERLNSPVVFTHNDLLLKNIVYNAKKERVMFIDYEYGAFNYEAYDIANHFCEYAGVDTVDYNLYPDKAYQLKWLRTFLEFKFEKDGKTAQAVADIDVERLYVQVQKFALVAHFFWGVWALIQAHYSMIDFDYMDYAIIRLDEYFRRKEEFLTLEMPA